jgi:hypothetical protein
LSIVAELEQGGSLVDVLDADLNRGHGCQVFLLNVEHVGAGSEALVDEGVPLISGYSDEREVVDVISVEEDSTGVWEGEIVIKDGHVGRQS